MVGTLARGRRGRGGGGDRRSRCRSMRQDGASQASQYGT